MYKRQAVHSNCEAVAQARILMLGVKPQMMASLLDEIKPVIKASLARGEEKIVVSMAAGLPISFYLSALDCPELPFLRIMPNTPAAVGQGMTDVYKRQTRKPACASSSATASPIPRLAPVTIAVLSKLSASFIPVSYTHLPFPGMHPALQAEA